MQVEVHRLLGGGSGVCDVCVNLMQCVFYRPWKAEAIMLHICELGCC